MLKNFKLVVSMLIFGLVFGLGINSVGAASGISIYINGEKQSYSNLAIMEKGRTLVPLRGIFESLGASVQYNPKDKTIDASKGNTKIWLKIGSKNAKVNGKTVKLDVPAKLEKGRTRVPVRFISESLGATVQWNQSTKAVNISSYSQNLIGKPTDFNYDTNSVGGVTIAFLADNISGKTINYYTVRFSTYNAVGDPSYDQITGKSKFSLRYVGPAYPGEQIVLYNLFTYQRALHKIVIDEIEIIFSDGTTATQKYGHSTTDDNGFY